MPSEEDPEAGPLGADWLAHMPPTKASHSHCACTAHGFPSLPVLSVTTSPRSVHAQHCRLLVALHFLVCLPWLGPLTLLKDTAWPAHGTAPGCPAWVWVKPFHVRPRSS